MSDTNIGMPIPLGRIETSPKVALALPVPQSDGSNEERLVGSEQIADLIFLAPMKIALATWLATAAFAFNPFFFISSHKLGEEEGQQFTRRTSTS